MGMTLFLQQFLPQEVGEQLSAWMAHTSTVLHGKAVIKRAAKRCCCRCRRKKRGIANAHGTSPGDEHGGVNPIELAVAKTMNTLGTWLLGRELGEDVSYVLA